MSKKNKSNKVVFPVETIHALVKELENEAIIHYRQKGNFTCAEARVYYHGKNYYDLGFSKCNPKYDTFDRLLGCEIARGKALKSMAKQILTAQKVTPVATLSQSELEAGLTRIEEMLREDGILDEVENGDYRLKELRDISDRAKADASLKVRLEKQYAEAKAELEELLQETPIRKWDRDDELSVKEHIDRKPYPPYEKEIPL